MPTWIHDRLRTGDVELAKVAGSDNVANVMTKYLGRGLLETQVHTMNLIPADGRAALAAQIGDQVVACVPSKVHDPVE